MSDEPRSTHPNPLPPSEGITVTFARSGITRPWMETGQSLLEFAEEHQIDISSGCRYGDCGTCMLRLFEGRVQYMHETGVEPDPAHCLACSCFPTTSISVDA